jgi:hypothetical protein
MTVGALDLVLIWCFDLVNSIMLFGFGPWGLDEGWRVERGEGRREWMKGFFDQ